MKIETALAKFLVQLEADGRSEHTRKQYRRHVRALARWLGSEGRTLVVEEIDHEDLALFLTSPAARTTPDGREKRAVSTNALRSSLRCFFAYLHASGNTRQNPARLIRRAQCSAPPPRPIPRAHLERLLAVLAVEDDAEARRDYLLFHLLAATGMRLGSALALEARDVDLGGRSVRVRKVKGDRVEELPLSAGIAEHLGAFLAERGEGPLFTDRRGRRISVRHAQRRFRRWAQRAGLRPGTTSHSLRHTFATALYRRTGDIYLVQKALGHRSIASTLVYAAADGERLRRSLEDGYWRSSASGAQVPGSRS